MYRLLVEGVRDYAIYLLDPQGIVSNWNVGGERMKGYTAEEIVGRNFECFYSAQDRDAGTPIRNLEVALRDGRFTTEGWRYRKDGSAFWAGVALDVVYDQQGTLIGFAKVTQDLSEQRSAKRRLQHQVLHDGLTGLANRVGLAECLAQHVSKISEDTQIAIHCVDLDRFKPVNDAFGHSIGDEVLREVGRRLEDVAGSGAIAARLGGDEFALIQFASVSDTAITAMADAILEVLNRPFLIGCNPITIGASVGVAVAPRDGREADVLHRSADMAMYRAKSDGRNCIRYFVPSMYKEALARRRLEADLRAAIDACEFYLVYQPIVDGQSSEVIAYEALLRWEDRRGVSVSPSQFLPIVEEIGLMQRLGNWVLRTACREAATWQNNKRICVNLSPTQLLDPQLPEFLACILSEEGLAGERLELEVTETAILEHLESASERLQRVRALGVGVALDDFGVGFSSLALVRALPLTRIKIDRSFIADLESDSRSAAVVEAVAALGRGYGVGITAEGIETEHQRRVLLASGCVDHQGYLYGRPAKYVQ